MTAAEAVQLIAVAACAWACWLASKWGHAVVDVRRAQIRVNLERAEQLQERIEVVSKAFSVLAKDVDDAWKVERARITKLEGDRTANALQRANSRIGQR